MIITLRTINTSRVQAPVCYIMYRNLCQMNQFPGYNLNFIYFSALYDTAHNTGSYRPFSRNVLYVLKMDTAYFNKISVRTEELGINWTTHCHLVAGL
jgi:hypothetical protein